MVNKPLPPPSPPSHLSPLPLGLPFHHHLGEKRAKTAAICAGVSVTARGRSAALRAAVKHGVARAALGRHAAARRLSSPQCRAFVIWGWHVSEQGAVAANKTRGLKQAELKAEMVQFVFVHLCLPPQRDTWRSTRMEEYTLPLGLWTVITCGRMCTMDSCHKSQVAAHAFKWIQPRAEWRARTRRRLRRAQGQRASA
jgi:hypothetical protein